MVDASRLCFIAIDDPSVSSRRERIEQANEEWAPGRFPEVPGRTELSALPAEQAGVPEHP